MISLIVFVAEHRGDRMACTPIMRKYRHKAVAREWFGNGAPTPVSGRLEFVQDEGDTSHSLVDLDGLGGQANSYHIHVVPVQPHLEFPCTGDAIGVHFAPFDFDPSASPKPATGTPDQVRLFFYLFRNKEILIHPFRVGQTERFKGEETRQGKKLI